MLYSHTGDFINLLPQEVNLLEETKKYKTFRMSIFKIFKSGNFSIGLARILARLKSKYYNIKENAYIQMQYMWKYSLPFLPKLEKEYDVAISYLWPHYFVADKVEAKTKIAWIHTDYSTIDTCIKLDLDMWNKFDYIISISDDVTKSFLSKYPSLKEKVILVENINSPKFVRGMSDENQNEIKSNNKEFKVVSVGRMSYAKGFDNAIKALKILHDRGLTEIKWYIVGYGEDEKLLKGIIEENKLEESFKLLGKKTNPYPYMKACDLYVQPSRYEGKAVTVTEAKILGKPILITNYTTANSQINHEFDGYITDLSIEGIADGIEKLYRNEGLRNKLASNCKNTDYGNNYELHKLYELFNR